MSSANCFIVEGATPVFADVDPRTLNLDPAALEAAITERTKAVVAVDMFGYPCELDEIRAICDRHGLTLIEDAAEALGAEYKGNPIGSHGVPGVFGFYPNKQLATGEGGIVFTHSEEEWQLLAEHAQPGPRLPRGRVVPPCAARAQLPLDRRPGRDRDRPAGEARPAAVAAVGGGGSVRRACSMAWRSSRSAPTTPTTLRSWFVYVVAVPAGVDRDRVMAELRAQGIGTAEYVPCVHLQPYMRETYGFAEGMCPVAEDVGRRTLALPFYPHLEAEDQERVVEALRAAL